MELNVLVARLDPIGTRCRIHDVPNECGMRIRKGSGRCTNSVSYCVEMSNGERMFCCGIKRHQHQAMQGCTNGVTGRMMIRLNNERFEVAAVELRAESDPKLPIQFQDAHDDRTRLARFVEAERMLRAETTSTRRVEEDVVTQIRALEVMRHMHRASIRRMERHAKLLRGAKGTLMQKVPFELEWRGNYNGDMICAICHDKMMPDRTAGMLNECEHAFHVKCIKRWFELVDTCPCCRTHCNTDRYRGIPPHIDAETAPLSAPALAHNDVH